MFSPSQLHLTLQDFSFYYNLSDPVPVMSDFVKHLEMFAGSSPLKPVNLTEVSIVFQSGKCTVFTNVSV